MASTLNGDFIEAEALESKYNIHVRDHNNMTGPRKGDESRARYHGRCTRDFCDHRLKRAPDAPQQTHAVKEDDKKRYTCRYCPMMFCSAMCVGKHICEPEYQVPAVEAVDRNLIAHGYRIKTYTVYVDNGLDGKNRIRGREELRSSVVRGVRKTIRVVIPPQTIRPPFRHPAAWPVVLNALPSTMIPMPLSNASATGAGARTPNLPTPAAYQAMLNLHQSTAPPPLPPVAASAPHMAPHPRNVSTFHAGHGTSSPTFTVAGPTVAFGSRQVHNPAAHASSKTGTLDHAHGFVGKANDTSPYRPMPVTDEASAVKNDGNHTSGSVERSGSDILRPNKRLRTDGGLARPTCSGISTNIAFSFHQQTTAAVFRPDMNHMNISSVSGVDPLDIFGLSSVENDGPTNSDSFSRTNQELAEPFAAFEATMAQQEASSAPAAAVHQSLAMDSPVVAYDGFANAADHNAWQWMPLATQPDLGVGVDADFYGAPYVSDHANHQYEGTFRSGQQPDRGLME